MELTFNTKNQCIEVFLFGDPFPEEMIENARTHPPNYCHNEVDLVVYQGYDEQMSQASIASSLRSGIIDELYKQNEQSLRS